MELTQENRNAEMELIGDDSGANRCDRRGALNFAAKAAVTGALLAIGGGVLVPTTARAQTATEFDVLNFALNLEYLEAEFYLIAARNERLPADLISGSVGTPGETTGGSRVNFTDPFVEGVARELAADELNHVKLIRSLLGARAIAKPAINLNALGIGFANDAEFLALSRAFEDVGVSAYGGAARLLTTRDVVSIASRILAVEALHSGNIRFQAVRKGVTGNAVDALDQLPASGNFFPTDPQGRAIIRTAAQVAAIVRGPNATGGAFFPNGLNGTIK